MKLWKYSGIYITVTGVLHTIMALILYKDVYLSMFRNGLINSIEKDPACSSGFWFFICGISLVLLGMLLQYYIKTTQRPAPVFFGYSLLVLSIIGCLVVPVSGFWLFIPQAVIIVFGNHRITKS